MQYLNVCDFIPASQQKDSVMHFHMGIEMSKGHVEHPARKPLKIRSFFILKQSWTS